MSNAIAKPMSALTEALPPPTTLAPFEESTNQGITYLGFLSKLAPNYDDVVRAIGQVPEYTPYLRYKGQYIRQDEPKFHYYTGARFFVQRDSGGKPLAAQTKEPETKEAKSTLKDSVEAIILVHVADTVVPAVVSFRGPKADIGVTADKELKAASTKDWVLKGKDYAIAAQIPVPSCRFTVTGHQFNGTVKYGKNAGSKFTGLKASIAPTTPGEADTLNKAAATPEFKKLLAAATETLDTRIKQLQALVK